MIKKTDIGVGLYLLFAIIFFIIPIMNVILITKEYIEKKGIQFA